MDDYDRASAMAQPAVAESKAARGPAVLARAQRAKASRPFVTGDPMGAAAPVSAGLHDQAAEVADEVQRHAEVIGAHAPAQGLPEAAP